MIGAAHSIYRELDLEGRDLVDIWGITDRGSWCDHRAIDEAAIYAERFPEADSSARYAMWQEIAGYLQRYVPANRRCSTSAPARAISLASLDARERWAVDLRPPWEPLASRMRFVEGSGLEPGNRSDARGHSTGCS